MEAAMAGAFSSQKISMSLEMATVLESVPPSPESKTPVNQNKQSANILGFDWAAVREKEKEEDRVNAALGRPANWRQYIGTVNSTRLRLTREEGNVSLPIERNRRSPQ
ncbi:hypothetical protein SBOR_3109 [Sclerotinia borealis F-4128]|uniref:Uncharacterized protein n=1 Tax=Sclerotinia borealis (strain F-4128) TaxID=1432307 RepID=W9CIA7_SCLBF|nr:hypothetical protein SBOR_3109 [Sclerotinia borealis F-4128]